MATPQPGDVSVIGPARLPELGAFTILVFGLRTVSSLESRGRYTLIRPDQNIAATCGACPDLSIK